MTSEQKDKVATGIGLAVALIVVFLSVLQRKYHGDSFGSFNHYGTIGGIVTVCVGVPARIILAFCFKDKQNDKKESS